jgi:GNAT superfamily N-acetyltransferase
MNFHIEPLERRHERAAFDCGEPALDEFIRRNARQNQDRGIGRTYVATEAGGLRVLGFYTLASGSILPADLPEPERRHLPRYRVPVVQLARLAVDRTASGQGIGEALLIDALRRSALAAEILGVFAVEVYAKHDDAAAFYRRYGFVPLEDDRLHLYLPISMVSPLL